MKARLTLRIDKDLVRKVKAYSRRIGKPLSKIVEDYFAMLTAPPRGRRFDLTPRVRRLKGMMRGAEVDEETYHRHIEKKFHPRQGGQIGRFRDRAGVSAKERSISETSGVASSSPSGRRASECLDRLRPRPPVLLDEGFGEDLQEVLEEHSSEE
jgi:hypothetical protein